MQLHWLKRTGSPSLAIFVLGWAADHHAVEHIDMPGCDILTIYDLRDLTPVQLPASYARVRLYAWSFGVWAAERIFPDTRFENATALNGTPHPVDELRGIEPRRIALTLKSIQAQGTDKFNKRAYGPHYDRLSPYLPPRPQEELTEELEYLCREGAVPYEPKIEWDNAVIGSLDEIFPPENMIRFWGMRGVVLPLRHYPFATTKIPGDHDH